MSYHSGVHANEVEQRLSHYRNLVEQWSTTLYELDENATYRLLAAGDLSGVTGDRANKIVETAPGLWVWVGQLRDRVEAVEKLVEEKSVFDNKADEIATLLEGPTILVSKLTLPHGLPQRVAHYFSAERDYDLDLATNCNGLRELFSATYEPVRDIVTEVDSVWRDLMPRIEAATMTLDRANGLCSRLGERVAEVQLATQRLEAVRASVADDPLSLSKNVGPHLDQLVAAAAKAAGALEHSHSSLGDDLANADATLADLRVLRARAAAAYSEAEAKVVVASGLVRVPSPAVIDGQNGLAHRARKFSEIDESDSEWRQARKLVDDWKASATRLGQQLERALESNSEPLKRRADMRSLLRAYKVKAELTPGLPEEVLDLGQQAEEELYHAPTNLDRAQRLIDEFAAAMSTYGGVS